MSATTTPSRTADPSRPTAPSRPAAPSTVQSVWLVASREIGARLRSKSFVISTLILFALAAGGVIWAGAAGGSVTTTKVAVAPETAGVVQGVPNLEVTDAASAEDAIALVEDGTVTAALVPPASVPEAAPAGSSFDYVIVADDSAPGMLVSMLSQAPPVHLLDPPTTDGGLRYLLAIGFGLVFLMAASTFGGTIAGSVVEEKQTRIVEILLSAIPVRALLAGKVLGNTVLAMGQIVILAAISIIGLSVTGQDLVLAGLGGPIAWFAVFFLVGFVLLAALFAAAGAMVSRLEDLSATTFPLTMLVMLPYFLVIFFNDNTTVLTVMSYVPFSAPVGMPMRLAVGEAAAWEPFLSLAILIASAIAAVLIGARIYENTLLRMGGRVKLGEALRG